MEIMFEEKQGSVGTPAQQQNPPLADETLPLSSAQQRLWFLDRFEPNTALYASPTRIWLRGPLDVPALEWAIESVVRRHEILRTVYGADEEAGRPYQVVRAPGRAVLEHVSLAQVDANQRETKAIASSAEFGRRAFDLAVGPVMRSQLIRLDPESHLLTISIHHIAGDGWSLGILCRELAAFYAERAFGQPADLPELPVQYADYAIWQREQMETEESRRELDYWKGKLSGSPGFVELPVDRPRPAVQTHRGDVTRRRISADLRERILTLGRDDQTTPFMVVLAALQAVLHGYSGSEDIAVGSPVANRNRMELEGLIGCFINTLVLRTKFNREESFRELLRRTRQTVLEAFEHQTVPFEEVINEVQPARSLNTSPLFNVLFVFHNFWFQAAQAGPLTFRPELAFTETAKFDLTLFTLSERDHLEFLVEYNTELFNSATVERLLEDLEVVLDSAVAEPDLPISRLTQSLRRVVGQAPRIATQTGVEAPARTPASRGSAVERLTRVWKELLGVPKVAAQDNFFELGGDSILAIQIISKARKLGLQLTPKQLFQNQTIAELAAVATEIQDSVQASESRQGSFPLTPIQRWFVEQFPALENHWNQAIEFELATEVRPETARQVIQMLAQIHPALRTRFVRGQHGWEQQVATTVEVPFEIVPASSLAEAAKAEHIRALQAGLDPQAGRVIHAALFQADPSAPSRLVIVIHHLVVDSVSWQILVEDFEALCENLLAGRPAELPPATTPYQAWARQLVDYAKTGAVASELEYWNSLPQAGDLLPLDFADAAELNTEASAATVTTQLTEAETANLLHRVPPVYKTHINDVLLAALALAAARRNGRDSILLSMEGHGREILWGDIDLSRTVGWFTSLFPVHLRVPPGADRGETLRAVKEQLRKIPHHGFGYGVLRYLRETGAAGVAKSSPPQLVFNYLGQLGQALNGRLIRLARIHMDTAHAAGALRPAQIEVNASVVNSKLNLDWTFSTNLYRPDTVEQFALLYVDCLRGLIDHCLCPDAGGSTPSDFALAGLSQQELDQIYSQFGEK